MEIKELREGEVLVLAPDGNLSGGEECSALEQRLGAAFAAGSRFVVVDCGKVGHLTSTALRALLLASRKLTRVGGRLVLCGMSPKVQKAFSISGFDKDFSVVPQRQAAVALVVEPPPGAAKAAAKKGAAAVAPAAAVVAPAAVAPTAMVAVAKSPASRAEAPGAPAAPSTDSAPAASAPAVPGPHAVLAERLLSVFGDAGGGPSTPPVPLPADRAAARDAAAAALLRVFAPHAVPHPSA
jgi:anti-sigma B factor antagonist